VRPVPPPEKPRKVPVLTGEDCAKCGAAFRWESSDPGRKGAPLVLRLVRGSAKCDCGYGRRADDEEEA